MSNKQTERDTDRQTDRQRYSKGGSINLEIESTCSFQEQIETCLYLSSLLILQIIQHFPAQISHMPEWKKDEKTS